MIVVGDTSIFLNLCRVGQEGLLPALFTEVFAPQEVATEFANARARLARFERLRWPEWVVVRPVKQPLLNRAPWVQLDVGESAALELALEIEAHAVLMDEANGRATATRLGLTAIGIVGILIRAKQVRLLPEIAPVLDDMQREARFFLSSADRATALRLAGETT